MTAVVFLRKASRGLEAAASYYNSRQPGLGQQFLAEVKKARDRNVLLPKAAPEVRVGIRRRSIHRFPYHVIYRLDNDQVLVIAIAHKRGQSDFWLGRV